MSDKKSFSIAYGMKKRAKKMAQGGSTGPIEQQLTDNYQSPCSADCNDLSHPHNQASGFVDHEGDVKRPSGPAMSEDSRKLNQHGAEEVGRQGNEGHYAEGGELKGVHEEQYESSPGESKAGEHARLKDYKHSKDEHYRILGELKADRRDRKFMAYGGEPEAPEGSYSEDSTCEVDPRDMAMAEGGQITDNYADTEDGDGRDMVGRIMKQRAQEYSKGGQVANKTDIDAADHDPAQYDDLVLRDDDMEDADYTGANSGDEKDSSAENARRSDIVSRVMKSRKKKDKLPNPR